MCERGQSLSELVGERMRLFPASGEINRRLNGDPKAPGGGAGAGGGAKEILKRVQGLYESKAVGIDFTDGLSLEFPEWRFNLRGSNTEPLVRLNVESRGNAALMQEKTAELLALLDS
jgi:phosphomannomutase